MRQNGVGLILAVLLATHVSAAEKKVTLATLEWAPYVGSELESEGLTAEVVKVAFDKAGYEIELEFYPWSRGLELAREGKVDGIFPAYRDPSREEHFRFSDPFAESPLGLYKMRAFAMMPGPGGVSHRTGYSIEFPVDPRIDQTEALSGLKQYTFGVVEGYVNTPEFDAADFLTKVSAPTDEENLRRLFRDEVQLVVIDKYVAQNIMAKKFPWRMGETEFMMPPLEVRSLYVAFSKAAPDVERKLADFNAGLRVIREDGVLDRLKRKYGF